MKPQPDVQPATSWLSKPCLLKSAGAAVVAAHLALLLILSNELGAQEPKDEEREVGDHPAAAAAFRESLLRNERGEVPPDALPKAAQRVAAMRQEVATVAGLQPEAMALLAGGGAPRFLAGIPVGPLPKTTSPDATAPRMMIAPLEAVITPAGWSWLGPGNIGGRIRSIVVHPTNPQIIWVGSVGGGVWKTTNAGVTWAPLTDLMASLAVSTLIIDPANPDILYAGTGEGFYNVDAIRGFGIFKTTDGGATWNQLSSTAGASAEKFRYVARLAIGRTADGAQVMFAATRSGLFRSTDAGASFAATPVLPGEILDVRVCRSDPKHCVASGRNAKTFYSEDAGATWHASSGIAAVTGFAGRTEVAFARAEPNAGGGQPQRVVYASVDDGLGKVYRSVDGGKTFTLRGVPSHLAGQGWYANTIWADDPVNPNLVLVGGLDLHRSTDGGVTFTRISRWQNSPLSAHADHHVIVAHPAYNGTTNRTVLFGNDGGIYRADNVSTVQQSSGWTELNHSLGATQFYGAGVVPATNRLVAGAQDNGTLMLAPSAGPQQWSTIFGGDGGESAADPLQDILYGEYVYLQIHRSTNGQQAQYIFQGISDAGDRDTALFIAPFILDPNNSKAMLAGGARLWRTADVKQANPIWASIKEAVPNSLISALAVTPGNSANLWVGYNSGEVFHSTNGLAATPTWKAASSGLPARQCTRLHVTAGTAPIVYATFSAYAAGNLMHTTDNGATWNSVGANALPEVPCYDITTHPDNKNTIILGTEVGLFVSEDGGTNWSPTNQGPTNAPVFRLFWDGRTLYAATHGRGIFKIDLSHPTLPEIPAPAIQSLAQ